MNIRRTALVAIILAAACAPPYGRLECHARTPAPSVDAGDHCGDVGLVSRGDKDHCGPEPAANEILYVSDRAGPFAEAHQCVADSATGKVFDAPVLLDLTDGNYADLRTCTEAERRIYASLCP